MDMYAQNAVLILQNFLHYIAVTPFHALWLLCTVILKLLANFVGSITINNVVVAMGEVTMLLWNTLTFVVNIFYYVFALVFTLLYFTFTCILWLNAAVRQKHRGNIWEASNIFESLVVILLAAGVAWTISFVMRLLKKAFSSLMNRGVSHSNQPAQLTEPALPPYQGPAQRSQPIQQKPVVPASKSVPQRGTFSMDKFEGARATLRRGIRPPDKRAEYSSPSRSQANEPNRLQGSPQGGKIQLKSVPSKSTKRIRKTSKRAPPRRIKRQVSHSVEHDES
ncbi:uncharacterized protein LOC111263116 isoform X1 [Varroa jacobsoni]|uniref:Uncharacterized protein n=1 Tax=Varroa destructor TaxID=109461 RepID=A0A7M7KLT2_VARDE|nr:uncharacterized protein LOC111252287 isoform X3 [Varroa destructor]XP_022693671.1 uncharacterized protein LOC111263116 isoform X1 [Varroa jacobsoni]